MCDASVHYKRSRCTQKDKRAGTRSFKLSDSSVKPQIILWQRATFSKAPTIQWTFSIYCTQHQQGRSQNTTSWTALKQHLANSIEPRFQSSPVHLNSILLHRFHFCAELWVKYCKIQFTHSTQSTNPNLYIFSATNPNINNRP
jgi:hypothetical protein